MGSEREGEGGEVGESGRENGRSRRCGQSDAGGRFVEVSIQSVCLQRVGATGEAVC